jgi:dolichyl-phosphate beta-glucosyltransferase
MTDLSIVIPALNEAAKIGRDVEAAARFLGTRGLSGEIIVVDDGSTDGTADAVRAVRVFPGIKVEAVRLERNAGKGIAVKTGVLKSSGELVLYADSGSCVPFDDAWPSIERSRAGRLDIGLGSRRHKDTILCRDRSWKRRVLSRVFHAAAVLIAGLPRRITDSQCGFKVYRGEIARELFSGLETPGFLFEIEIILKALARGLVLEEFPVTWTCDPDSRLRPGSQALPVLRELVAVRRRVRAVAGKSRDLYT